MAVKKSKPVKTEDSFNPVKPKYSMFSIYMRAKNRKGEYIWS